VAARNSANLVMAITRALTRIGNVE
jgi:hypothetical protein